MNISKFFLIFFLALISIFLIHKNLSEAKVANPEDVVSEFFRLSKEKKYDEMQNLVTNYPESYEVAFQMALNDVAVIVNGKPIANNQKNKLSDAFSGNLATINPIRFSKEFLVKSFLDSLDEKRSLKETISIKEFGNEARVIVSMQKDNLKNTEYSLLLYKENESWMIFEISNYEKLTPQLDLAKYWAIDRNK